MRSNNILILMNIVFISSLLTACSDDKTPVASAPVAAQEKHISKTPISHTLANSKVSDEERQKFEKAFAEQCIKRELKHTADPNVDAQSFEKPCTCIATFMMKDITAIEAEKFLVEHENVRSLKIKYDNAAYHCLQQKVPEQEPIFTHPSQQ